MPPLPGRWPASRPAAWSAVITPRPEKITVQPSSLGSSPRRLSWAATARGSASQPTCTMFKPPAVLSADDSSSIVAGGDVTREAASIVLSRSNGAVAAVAPTSRSTRETLAVSRYGRRGPYSTCPLSRRGVSPCSIAWPAAGFTTYATAFVLESPAERSSERS